MSLDHYKQATPDNDGGPYYEPTETDLKYVDLIEQLKCLTVPKLTGATFTINNCPIRELKEFAKMMSVSLRNSRIIGEYVIVKYSDQIFVRLIQ